MDSIKKASSGHMGLPLGCAEIGAVLFGQEMCASPLLARASLLFALLPAWPTSSSPAGLALLLASACSRGGCNTAPKPSAPPSGPPAPEDSRSRPGVDGISVLEETGH